MIVLYIRQLRSGSHDKQYVSRDKTIVRNVATGECTLTGNQLEETLRNECGTIPEHFNFDTKTIIGMIGEGQNTNPEMYIW